MALLYLMASGGLAVFAWGLQHIVYHPPPQPGQMYAAVFVRDPAAHVSLSAEIDPSNPWNDSLTVAVSRVPPSQAGWLLVIECPGSVSRSSAVPLYSEATQQAQSPPTVATIDTGIANPGQPIMFGCFTKPKNPSAGSGYSLANVSVAALQLDNGMVGAPGLPVLYAQQSRPGGAASRLVQIFPNVSCPSATPTALPTTSNSAATPASPSTAATPQPSTGSTAPAPQASSPSSPPTAAANPGCLHLGPANAKFIKYEIPNTEPTIETLQYVDYRNYQLSMYPTGNTPAENNGDESIIWNAPSAQDPSFDATNTATQLNGQRDLFISGVLWGIVGGVAVACLEHLYSAYQERRGKPPGRYIGL
jgi:hypothetical protein